MFKSVLTFIIYMIVLGLFLLIIRMFIPAAGRFCLVSGLVDTIMLLCLCCLSLFCVWLLFMDHTFKSIVIGVIFVLLSLVCLWGTADSAKVILDIGTEPQKIVLDECQCKYQPYRNSKNTYKLVGTCDGKRYIFDVGGLNSKMLRELGEKHSSAVVTYYKNSMSVVSVEPRG